MAVVAAVGDDQGGGGDGAAVDRGGGLAAVDQAEQDVAARAGVGAQPVQDDVQVELSAWDSAGQRTDGPE